MYRKIIVGCCKHCGSTIYYDEDNECLVFTGYDCLCELDKDDAPEWLLKELS